MNRLSKNNLFVQKLLEAQGKPIKVICYRGGGVRGTLKTVNVKQNYIVVESDGKEAFLRINSIMFWQTQETTEAGAIPNEQL